MVSFSPVVGIVSGGKPHAKYRLVAYSVITKIKDYRQPITAQCLLVATKIKDYR